MKRSNALTSLSLCAGLATAGCAESSDPSVNDPAFVDSVLDESSPAVAEQRSTTGSSAIVEITGIHADGTGCRAGTWEPPLKDIDPTTKSAWYSIRFNDYRLDVGPSQVSQTKNCTITFSLKVAPGLKAGIAKAILYVDTELGVGMTSTLETSIGFTGQTRYTVPWRKLGPVLTGRGNEEIKIDRYYPVEGRCRTDTDVTIETKAILSNPVGRSGSLSLKNVDTDVALSISFGTEPCTN